MINLEGGYYDEAGDGTGGGGAGGGDGTPGTGDGGAGSGAGESSSGGGDGHWLDSVADTDLKAWGITKGWKDPSAALQSTRHLESMLGAPADQIVRLPAGGVDLENGREIFSRLGMPAEAKDYTFNIPEGMEADLETQAWARDIFHQAGISQAQADKISDAFTAKGIATGEGQAVDSQRQFEAGDQNLRSAWGDGYEGEVHKGQLAVSALGFTKEMVDGLENSIGYEATMQHFAKLGARLGEDTFEFNKEGGGQGDFGMTPDAARARYQERLGDSGWREALTDNKHPNHKAVVKEKSELYAIMYPEG